MKYNLYSIKDLKVGYGNPWTANGNGEATRAFEEAIKSKQGIVGSHPTDMELWKIGEYDQDTGNLTNELEYVCAGKDFKTSNLSELDQETLKKVLDNLIEIKEEQERERQAFVDVKDKLHIADTKFAQFDNKIEKLEKTKMNKIWGKK